METGAEFSECGKYRYLLYRIWDKEKPSAMCVGLNPSTADATSNDPTIKRLISLLKNNGYGSLYMTNLFALVSPYPEDLRLCPDPIKDNDLWLEKISMYCSDVILCYGNFKQSEYRRKIVSKIISKPELCFGKNTNGTPKHPLYLKTDTKLQRLA